MRIESVHIARYGCLEKLETASPLSSVVVVLGPNESGKSTFFSFLTDLLYGFSPASRERHPRTPWSGSGDPEGSARIRLDEGTVIELQRRLGASGQGSASDGDRTEELRNRAFPAVQHVGRGIFRQVYALTLRELASLEGESWALVQDRLVAALGMKGLRPPRKVAAALVVEANRLWRSDRRGKPLARTLRKELAIVREGRREAVERDESLRGAMAGKRSAEEERAEVRRRLADKRDFRTMLEDRLARLQPVREVLVRIAELREQSGARQEIDGLPGDPAARLEELRRRHSEVGIRIEDRKRREATCREAIEAYGHSHHPVVLGAEERVIEAIDRRKSLIRLDADAQVAREKVDGLIAEGEEAGQSFFVVPWKRVPLSVLAAVPRVDMMRRLGVYERAQAATQIERENAERPLLTRVPRAEPPSILQFVGAVAALAAGLGLAAWPILRPDSVLPLPAGIEIGAVQGATAAVVLGIAGVILLLVHRAGGARFSRYQRALADAEQMRARRIAKREKAEEDARAAVVELVSDLSIAPGELATLDPGLVAKVGELGDLARRIMEANEEMDARVAVVEEVRRDIREVEVGLRSILPRDSGKNADMGELLDSARQAREAMEAARRSQEREAEERKADEGEFQAVGRELAALRERLSPLGGGNADRGARVAAERMAAAQRAKALRSELERSHKDLAEREEEIARAEADGESWEGLRERIDEVAERIDAMTARVETLQATIATLETRIGQLSEGDAVDAIDGRIAVLEEGLRRAREDRDRALVISRLIRTADRRFRDENQPELVLRAERYLRQVTAGRYDRIELGDEDDEIFRLRRSPVGAPAGGDDDLPRVRVDECLSQGTREQVYFAIRLAIVNHLDAGHETLPIFMDEAFVNWDAWRRDGALDLLEQLAEERQVFVFTCHPAMAAEMEDRGAAIVPLPNP